MIEKACCILAGFFIVYRTYTSDSLFQYAGTIKPPTNVYESDPFDS